MFNNWLVIPIALLAGFLGGVLGQAWNVEPPNQSTMVSVPPQNEPIPVIRTKDLQIVDSNGDVRARIHVAPPERVSPEKMAEPVQLIVLNRDDPEITSYALLRLDHHDGPVLSMVHEDRTFQKDNPRLVVGSSSFLTSRTLDFSQLAHMTGGKLTDKIVIDANQIEFSNGIDAEIVKTRSQGKDSFQEYLSHLNGKRLMTLSSKEGAAELVIRDKGGMPRITLETGDDGPKMTMKDAKSNSRLTLGRSDLSSSDGSDIKLPEGSLTIFNEDGKVLTRLP